MDESFERTTKPSQIMREVLVIPKPGLGMLALFLGGLVLGGVIFVAGVSNGECPALRSRGTGRRCLHLSA